MRVHQFPDRRITIEGKEYLYFGGTAYLGVATNEDFLASVQRNLAIWGASYGSSRNANIQLSVYEAFENFFANQVNAESSLVISSGTLAGKLVIENLSKQIQKFYHYPGTHPAVLAEGSQAIFKDDQIHPELLTNKEEEIVITADTILGLATTPTPFDFLKEIAPAKKITLIVDESHSLGIVGKEGEGVFHTIAHKNIARKILVSSLGKALALPCGIIAADESFITTLRREPLFVSSSGAAPAFLGAYLESQQVYKNQRKKLMQNLDYIHRHLERKHKLHFTHNYPVIYSESDTIFRNLQRKGIIIASFNYPTYKTIMNRVVITANHTLTDLKFLVEQLNSEEL